MADMTFAEHVNIIANLDNSLAMSSSLNRTGIAIKAGSTYNVISELLIHNKATSQTERLVVNGTITNANINAYLGSVKTAIEAAYPIAVTYSSASTGTQVATLNTIDILIALTQSGYYIRAFNMKILLNDIEQYNIDAELVNPLELTPNILNLNQEALLKMSNIMAISSDIETVSDRASDIQTVSSNIDNINTIVSIQNLTNITTIANDLNAMDLNGIADVTVVANDLVLGVNSNIVKASGSISDVGIVADNIEAVQTVANINSEVTSVALIDSEIITVANAVASIETANANAANINIVAGSIGSVNNVATTIVPNISEILLADYNASIATTKAADAMASANSAGTSAASAASALASIEAMNILTINDAVPSLTEVYSSQRTQDLHNAQQEAIASLSGASAAFYNSTSTLVPESPAAFVDLTWTNSQASTNSNIFELGANEINFYKDGNYSFLNTLTFYRLSDGSVMTVTFEMYDADTAVVIGTVVQSIDMTAGTKETLPLNAVITISGATSSDPVRMKVRMRATGANGTLELFNFNSILAAQAVVDLLNTETDPVFTAWDKSTGISIVKSQVSDFPVSMPASDVYAWAKEADKPTYTKSEIGLANIDNTSDANKPISSATQTALNLKANASTTVSKTSANGSAILPYGTTGQRDAAPASGYLRMNTSLQKLEYAQGTIWYQLARTIDIPSIFPHSAVDLPISGGFSISSPFEDVALNFNWTATTNITANVTTATAFATTKKYALVVLVGGGKGGDAGVVGANSFGGQAGDVSAFLVNIAYAPLATPLKYKVTIGTGGVAGTTAGVAAGNGEDTIFEIYSNNDGYTTPIFSYSANGATFQAVGTGVNFSNILSQISSIGFYDGSFGTNDNQSTNWAGYGGGATFLSRGGNGGNATATPTVGASPAANTGAGGGAGACYNNTTRTNGGAGGSGKVIIYYPN